MKSTATVAKSIRSVGQGAPRRLSRRRFEGPGLSRHGSVVVLMIISLMGCTTLQPVAGTPHELRQRIASGEVLKPGDRVVIATDDGHEHKFAIKAVDSGSVRGRHDSVSIDQIVYAQKREFSPAKTVGLVGVAFGIVLVGQVVAATLAAPAVIFDSVP